MGAVKSQQATKSLGVFNGEEKSPISMGKSEQ